MSATQVAPVRPSAVVCLVVLLSVVLASPARAVPITSTPASVWELFPKTQQGENGIRAQGRDGGSSTYYDLTWTADYTFKSVGAAWELPKVWRGGSISNQVFVAEPADDSGGSFDRDIIIRALLSGAQPEVRVTGRSGTDSSTSMTFYIYKGAGNWNAPIWQAGPNVSFDLTTPFVSGDELFFGVDAGASCVNDWGRWYDLTLTGVGDLPPTTVPEPAGLALVGLALLCLRRRSA